MAIAGGSIQFLQAGLLQQAFGAYVAVLTEERGWSKTALSGAAAMQSMEAALLGPLRDPPVVFRDDKARKIVSNNQSRVLGKLCDRLRW